MRTKSLKRKLSNALLLGMLLVIAVGIYFNIYNSRAENVIEIGAIANDNYGYLEGEEFNIEAKDIGEDKYEIYLPGSVNGKVVNKTYNVVLEKIETEISKPEADANVEVESETETEPTGTEKPSEEPQPSTETEQTVETQEPKIEITDNKFTLTKEQLEKYKLVFEVSYDMAILKETEEGWKQKDLLSEKTEEERKALEITEETEILYNKVLKYEDEKNEKIVELKGFLPKEASLKVRELTKEELKEIFKDGKIDVAYDITIIIETITEDGTIEYKEINPEEFGETCQVSITDSKVEENTKIYHVSDDKQINEVDVTENEDETITFESPTFSVYALVSDEQTQSGIMLAAVKGVSFSSTTPIRTWARSNTVTASVDGSLYKMSGYAITQSTSRPSVFTGIYDESSLSTYLTASLTTEGNHYVHVKYQTTGSNPTTSYTYSGPYWIDRTGPTSVTATSSAGGNWTNENVTVTLAASDNNSGIDHYEWNYRDYSIGDFGDWRATSGTTTQGFSAEQDYTAEFRAVDKAGNVSHSIDNGVTVRIRIDKTPPTVNVSTPAGTSSSSPTYVNSATYTVSGTAVDPVSGELSCSGLKSLTVNGTAVTVAADGAWSHAITLTQGTTTVTVVATDNAGNTTTVTRYVCYDTIAPTGNVFASPSAQSGNTYYTNQQTVTIYVNNVADTGGSGYSWGAVLGWFGGTWGGKSKDIILTYDSANNRYYSTFTLNEIPHATSNTTNNGQGTYTFAVHLYDNAGNLGQVGSATVIYDTTAPTGNVFASPGVHDGNTYYTKEPTVTIYVDNVADTGGSGYSWGAVLGWFGGAWTQHSKDIVMTYDSANNRYYSTFTLSEIPHTTSNTTNNGQGTYTFAVHLYDNAGNIGQVGSATVIYDTTAPTLTVTAPTGTSASNPTYTENSTYTVTGSTSDALSGISSLTVNGTAVAVAADGTWSHNITLAEGSTTTVTIVATDKAGNTKTETRYVCLDSTPKLIITGELSGVTDSSLIRYYDGTNNLGNGHSNATTTWKDLSGHNDGIIHGAQITSNSMFLDGTDDWINLGQVTGLTAVTLEASFSLNTTSGTQSIISNQNAGGMALRVVNGKPQFGIHVGGACVYLTYDEVLETGTIYNISGTWDGTRAKLYVNGGLLVTSTASGAYKDPTDNTVMVISGNPYASGIDTSDPQMAGMQIYSARIYNRALDETEIRKNMNADRTNVGPASDDNVILAFIFNKAVTGFEADDITVTGGTKGTLTKVMDGWYKMHITDIQAESNLEVSIAEGSYTDASGNAGDSAGLSRYRDTIGPIPTIVGQVAAGNATTTYTITFNESNFGLNEVDSIFVENGTLVAGSLARVNANDSTVYTVTVNNTADGTQTLLLDLRSTYDICGNNNENEGLTGSVTIDKSSPTVTITADKTSPTNANSITYTFTFSEPVTAFNDSDVIINIGTKSTFTKVSDSVYTLVVTNTVATTTGINKMNIIQEVEVNSGACADFAGNINTAASTTIVIDKSRPGLTITGEATEVTNGLVMHFDGTNNTGYGHFDGVGGGTRWKDLAGNYDPILSSGVTSGENDINLNASGENILIGEEIPESETATAEASFKLNNLTGTVAFFEEYEIETVVGFYVSNGRLTSRVYNGNDREECVVVKLDDQLETNRVYNVSAVFDGEYLKLYIDGILHGAEKIATGTNVSFGGTMGTLAYVTTGTPDIDIYSARYYSRALSQVEIKQNMNADRINVGPANNDSVTLSFIFDEDITGFDVNDITVTNGTKGTLTKISDSEYKLPITGIAAGAELQVSVAEGSYLDAAGNSGTAKSISRLRDVTGPVATITATTPANATNKVTTYTINFSESNLGLTEDCFAVANCSIVEGSLARVNANSSLSYTIQVNSPTEGQQSLGLRGGVVYDIAGNSNATATGTTTVDFTAPTFTITPYGNLTPAKSHTVTITISDTGSGLASISEVKYQWYKIYDDGTESPAIGITELDIPEFSIGEDSIELEITQNGFNGTYYLYVEVIGLLDCAGNAPTHTQDWTNNFVFDNTSPNLIITGEATVVKDNKLMIHLDGTNNVGNGHNSQELSGDSNVTGYWYNFPNGSRLQFSQAVTGVFEDNCLSLHDNKAMSLGNVGFRSPLLTVETSISINNHYSGMYSILTSKDGTGLWYSSGEILFASQTGELAFLGETLDCDRIYNISATYDGTNIKLYVDGILHATEAATITTNQISQVWNLGPYDMKVYSVRMYNRVLSQAEIQQNMNADRINVGPANNDSVTLSFIFDENITGFDANDITVTNGTKGTLTKISDSEYTLPVTGITAGAELQVSVAAGSYTDIPGNTGTAASTSRLRDVTGPTITMTPSVAITNAATSTYTINLSESNLGLRTDDITITNGTIASLARKATDSSLVYTLTVNNTGSGIQTVSIRENAVFDIAGNGNVASGGSAIVDTTAPTMSLSLDNAAWAKTHTVTVTLSDATSGLATGIQLQYAWQLASITNAPTSGWTTTNVTGYSEGAKTATVDVTGSGYNGSYKLWIKPVTGKLKDTAGNINNNTATSGVFNFDNTSPNLIITGEATGVTNGLIKHLDGTNNMGNGHSNSEGVYWKDLSGVSDAWSQNPSQDGIFETNRLPIFGEDGVSISNISLSSPNITVETSIILNSIQQGSVGILVNEENGTGLWLMDGMVLFSNSSGTFAALGEKLDYNRVYNISATYDGTNIKLYVDGILHATQAATITASELSSDDWVLGGGADIAVYSVRMYNRALSQTEIKQNMNADRINVEVANNDSVTLSFIFDENITGFTADDITVTNGTKGTLTKISNSEYKLPVTGITAGAELQVSVAAGSYTDIPGNNGTAASISRLRDVTGPTVTVTPSSTVTNAATTTYTINLSESNLGLKKDDITVTNGTIASLERKATGTNDGRSLVYILTVNNTNDGTQTVAIRDNAAFDIAGNGNTSGTGSIVIDTTAPSISLSPNSNTTYAKTHTVTVTLSDATSGLATGIQLQYAWQEKLITTEPASWDGTITVTGYAAGAKTATTTITGKDYTGEYKLWVKPVTDKLKDVAGNKNNSTKTSEVFNFDNTAPIVIIDPEGGNSTWKKSHTVSISVMDDESLLASDTQFEITYGWSTTETGAPTNTKTEYYAAESEVRLERAIEITQADLTGKYYLVVQAVVLKDQAGNSTTAEFRSTGTFWFDNTAPTISISPNSNSTWAQKHKATVTISDSHSGLANSLTLKYAWVENGTTLPTNWETNANIIKDTVTVTGGTNSATFEATTAPPDHDDANITKGLLSNKYYLHVIPVNVKDRVAETTKNEQTTNKRSTGTFYLDTTGPLITAEPVTTPGTWYKTHQVKVTIWDGKTDGTTLGSGLALGAKFEYGWSTSKTTQPSSWESQQMGYEPRALSATYTVSQAEYTGEYYFWYRMLADNSSDTAGNGNNAVAATVIDTPFKFDNTSPTMSAYSVYTVDGDLYQTDKEKYAKGGLEVLVVMQDNHAGLPAGSKLSYLWVKEGETVPTSGWTTLTGDNTEVATSEQFTIPVSKSSSLNGIYRLYIKAGITADNVADSTKNTNAQANTDLCYHDNYAPQISFSPNEYTTWSIPGKQVVVTIDDRYSGSEDVGGLAKDTAIQYQWATSSSALKSDGWATVTGTNSAGAKYITRTVPVSASNNLTGTYYLYVKAACVSDNVVTTTKNTNTAKNTSLFRYDNTKPTITVPAGPSDWKTAHSATVTIADEHSKLAANAQMKYQWVSEDGTHKTDWVTVNVGNAAAASPATFTATGSGLTGRYDLVVAPVTLKDTAETGGNSQTESVTSEGTYLFDNTDPTVSLSPNTPTTGTRYVKGGVAITATLADEHAGLVKNAKIQYQWVKVKNDNGTDITNPTLGTWTTATATNTAAAASTTITIPASKSNTLNGVYRLYINNGITIDNVTDSTTENSNSANVKSDLFYFDNHGPEITVFNPNERTTYYRAGQSVIVTIDDTYVSGSTTMAGLDQNISIQYQWAKSESALTSDGWATVTGTNAAGAASTTRTVPALNIPEQEGGTYYLFIKANSAGDYVVTQAGAETTNAQAKAQSGGFNFDKIKPTIELNPNTKTTYTQEGSEVTVTMRDSLSGLCKDAITVYQWVKEGEEPVDGEWGSSLQFENKGWRRITGTNAEGAASTTRVIPQSSSAGLTGKYYLYIKQGTVRDDVKDSTGNVNDQVVSDVFYFDNTQTEIEFVPEKQDTSWTTGTAVTVKGTDNDSLLIVGAQVKYQWVKVGETPTDAGWKTLTATNTAPQKNLEWTVPKSASQNLLNGKYNLYIQGGSLKDVAGNSNQEAVSGIFEFDNTKPVITLSPNTQTDKYSKGTAVTVTISDEHSGLKADTSIQYQWATSASALSSSGWKTVTGTNAAGITGTDDTTNTTSITRIVPADASSTLTGTYYLFIKAGSVRDNVTDTTSKNVNDQITSEAFHFDNATPAITFTPNGNGTQWWTAGKTTVVISDGNSGVPNSLNIQYKWVKDDGTSVTDWQTKTGTKSGDTTSIEINIPDNLTGKYSLWIKENSFTDNAVGLINAAGTEDGSRNYNVLTKSAVFNLDNTKPTISFSEEKYETWINGKDVTVTVNDTDAGLAASQKIQYQWILRSDGVPAFNNLTITSTDWTELAPTATYTAGTKTVTYKIPKSVSQALETGKYQLYVKAMSVRDNVTDATAKNYNIQTATTGVFWFDNTKPTVTIEEPESYWIRDGQDVTVTLSDSHGGIKAKTNVYYQWVKVKNDDGTEIASPTIGTYTKLTTSNTAATNSVSVTVPKSASASLNGYYALYIQAGKTYDNAGNANDLTTRAEFKFDNTLDVAGEMNVKINNVDYTAHYNESNGEGWNADRSIFTGAWSKENVWVERKNSGADYLSGISGYSWTVYDEDGNVYAANYVWPEEFFDATITDTGIYTVIIEVEDNACLQDGTHSGNTATRTYTVKLDKEAPITGTLTTKLNSSSGSNYSGEWDAGNNVFTGNWTNQSVYIKLNNGSDARSGHKESRYSVIRYINNNDYTAGTNGVAYTVTGNTLSETGIYVITVTTEDKALLSYDNASLPEAQREGNTSSKTYIIKIDKKEPIAATATIVYTGDVLTNSSGEEWTKEDVKLTINNDAVDNIAEGGSGVKETLFVFKKDGVEQAPQVGTELTLSETGVYTVEIETVDHAGNTKSNSYTIRIDKTAPEIGALVSYINIGRCNIRERFLYRRQCIWRMAELYYRYCIRRWNRRTQWSQINSIYS